MIPSNITREHIVRAAHQAEEHGIPLARGSSKYLLEYDGRYYPPKYVLSLANRYANGRELSPSEFSGGHESNSFLANLGFKIIEISHHNSLAPTACGERRRATKPRAGHSERCLKCKETIRLLLKELYGDVQANHRIHAGVHPDAFRGCQYYGELQDIYKALQNNRGFRDFLKTESLPRCDFFIAEPGFIVEFDESQHFTFPRRLALELYPDDLVLGFDRRKWMSLCHSIGAKDNEPAYRDEQRAWYDTLRDFLPAAAGLRPTVRLFARDYKWCTLNPGRASDVQRFEHLLHPEPEKSGVKIHSEPAPFAARVVICDEWNGDPHEAGKLLETIHEKWPKDRKVRFVITCGGFMQFDWPKSVSRPMIGDPIHPDPGALASLVSEAEESVMGVMTPDLVSKLRDITDYITLGVDSHKTRISMTQHHIGEPHVELVCIVDLKNNRRYWTGKSYPTTGQQNGLVRFTNLDTHFIDLADVGKVMVLGCHDLTVFNPRSRNARGWRQSTNMDFRALSRKHRPVCVLHHPHSTVKVRTWMNAWNGLTATLPSVKRYAGAGRYHESDRMRAEWDPLDSVLRSTKCGPTLDFTIRGTHRTSV